MMAGLWNSINNLDSFPGEASLAAANRHDMCPPRRWWSSRPYQSENETALTLLASELANRITWPGV